MTTSSVRDLATEYDWQMAYEALCDMAATAPTKQMHRGLNPDKAVMAMMDRTLSGAAHTKFVDGYLVHYAVDALWYTDLTVLYELLIVRVGPGGTLKGVAQFLRDEARAAGAAYVAVGTSFAKNDAALARLYQAAGFTPEATTLTLETS